MISRKNRFHGYGSLNYVYQHGQTIRGPLISLKYSVNPKRTSYRLAVVVSKKVHKSAVARNRIRRRIYEVVRGLQISSDPANDLVITVYSPKLIELSPSELEATVKDQFQQAKIPFVSAS